MPSYIDILKEKHLKKILEEMCRRVGANYSVVNSSEDWYLKYSWTKSQENDFRNWLFNYLKNNKEARKSFGLLSDDKEIEKFVDMFIFQYGWTDKKEAIK